MSKRDFEMIARVLRADTPTLGHWQAQQYRDEIIKALVVELAATNPRFDRERFVAACRGEDAKDSAGRRVRYSAAR